MSKQKVPYSVEEIVMISSIAVVVLLIAADILTEYPPLF